MHAEGEIRNMPMFEENHSKPQETIGDYLWDGSGEPDPQIQRLEKMLVNFRHSGSLLALAVSTTDTKQRSRFANRFWLPCFAIATIVAIILTVSAIIRRGPLYSDGDTPGWNVARIEGTPQIGKQFITGEHANAKLRVGQTLETNATSRATISDDDLGEVKVDPNSRVRLLQADTDRKRIQLDVGTIHAMIWAPPGQFVVDTPSAVAVDLGCAYTLQVSPDGSGTIRTTLGWVGFHLNGRDSFIPAGAMCATHPHVGPGTPYFEDAPEAFRNALIELDFRATTEDARASALKVVLSLARQRDGLTLWHLLFRTNGRNRELVYDRFAALVPPPPGVTRDGVLHLESEMLDAWWNALNLGDISIWRFWEQSSSPNAATSGQFLQKKQMLLKQPR
jgi:FecR protein